MFEFNYSNLFKFTLVINIKIKMVKLFKTFEEEGNKIHNNKFSYIEETFINMTSPMSIKCNIHGIFQQKPYKHLTGQGCAKCIGRGLTKNEFMYESLLIHNNKFSYLIDGDENSIIKKSNQICIICKIHREFYQTPHKHLQGQGCPKCSPSYKDCKNSFIHKFSLSFPNIKFDFEESNYINSSTKIKVKCNENHLFEMRPNDLLNGHGCKECANKKSSILQRKTMEDFITKVKQKQGNKYDYSKVDYINCETKICIICKTHGEFYQTPHHHLQSQGCPKCSIILVHDLQKKSIEEFITEAIKRHGDKYDYSKVDYNNNKANVLIICNIHGEFYQTPKNHLKGHGCKECANKTEGKLYEILKQLYPSITTQFKQEWCKKISYLPFDFCIPEYKIIIELDGPQHFRQVSNWSSPKEQFEMINIKKNVRTIMVIQLFVFYKKMYFMILTIGIQNYVKQLKNSKMEIK